MPVLLFRFLGPLVPWLAGAGALLGVVLYIVALRHELTAAAEKNVALAQANQADAAAIADYQAQEARWNAAEDTLAARTQTVAAAAGHIEDRIAASPPGDDAPVAPVLARALASLRALQTGATP